MIANITTPQYRLAWTRFQAAIFKEMTNKSMYLFWEKAGTEAGIIDIKDSLTDIKFKSEEDATAFILKWG